MTRERSLESPHHPRSPRVRRRQASQETPVGLQRGQAPSQVELQPGGVGQPADGENSSCPPRFGYSWFFFKNISCTVVAASRVLDTRVK